MLAQLDLTECALSDGLLDSVIANHSGLWNASRHSQLVGVLVLRI